MHISIILTHNDKKEKSDKIISIHVKAFLPHNSQKLFCGKKKKIMKSKCEFCHKKLENTHPHYSQKLSWKSKTFSEFAHKKKKKKLWKLNPNILDLKKNRGITTVHNNQKDQKCNFLTLKIEEIRFKPYVYNAYLCTYYINCYKNFR